MLAQNFSPGKRRLAILEDLTARQKEAIKQTELTIPFKECRTKSREIKAI